MKICFLVLHGIGVQRDGYADQFVEEIKRRFSALTNDQGALITECAIYADVLDDAEKKMWHRFNVGHIDLRWKEARKYFVSYLADALIYQQSSSIYDAVHRRILKSIRKLSDSAGPGAILCIAAHSLGSVIMSNLLWDATLNPSIIIKNAELRQELNPETWNLLDSVAYIWTFGSPLAVWSARFNNPQPIKVPGKKVRTGHWKNLIDPDDVLAYPLSGVGIGWQYIQDLSIDVGNILTGWNPVTHTGYWQSKGVLDLIAYDLSMAWRTGR